MTRYFTPILTAIGLCWFCTIKAEASTPQMLPGKTPEIYASELATFFVQIRDHLPTLSPSQEKWLSQEIKHFKETNDYTRYLKAQDTREFGIHSIVQPLDGILDHLEKLQDKRISRHEQLQSWVLVANFLIDASWWSVLYSEIRHYQNLEDLLCGDKKHRCDDQTLFYLNNGTNPASHILQWIIFPGLHTQAN